MMIKVNINLTNHLSVVEVLASTEQVPIGTYALVFELSSDCGYTDSKTLDVIVVNSVSRRSNPSNTLINQYYIELYFLRV